MGYRGVSFNVFNIPFIYVYIYITFIITHDKQHNYIPETLQTHIMHDHSSYTTLTSTRDVTYVHHSSRLMTNTTNNHQIRNTHIFYTRKCLTLGLLHAHTLFILRLVQLEPSFRLLQPSFLVFRPIHR